MNNRITSHYDKKESNKENQSEDTVEKTKNNEWLLDVTNPLNPFSPLSPLSPINIFKLLGE